MGRGRMLVALVGVLLGAGPALAQWKNENGDDGAYHYGVAVAPSGVDMIVSCFHPSLGGKNPAETGAHELTPMPPFTMRLEFGPDLIPFDAGTTRFVDGFGTGRDDLTIWVDNQGYAAPLTWFDELNGYWVLDLPMTDAMVPALWGAQRFVYQVGNGPAFEVPFDGAAAAISAASKSCIDHLAKLGNTPPPDLMIYFNDGFEETAPEALPTLDGPMFGLVNQAVQAGCSGANPVFGPSYLLIGDMDGDGANDGLVNWHDIQCGNSRPMCGASNCSGEIVLSGQGARAPEANTILGQRFDLIDLDNGLKGVAAWQGVATCGNASACAQIIYWDGAQLQVWDQLWREQPQ